MVSQKNQAIDSFFSLQISPTMQWLNVGTSSAASCLLLCSYEKIVESIEKCGASITE